ncbi:MAG: hypothetical protein C6I01_02060 [Epsilonproteobacteria bacterium]|nr:hypothetical protein [Campylobacterota bacterium]
MGRKGRKLYFWGRGRENFFKKNQEKGNFSYPKGKEKKGNYSPLVWGKNLVPSIEGGVFSDSRN